MIVIYRYCILRVETVEKQVKYVVSENFFQRQHFATRQTRY